MIELLLDCLQGHTLTRCCTRNLLTSSISRKMRFRRLSMAWLISASCSLAKSCMQPTSEGCRRGDDGPQACHSLHGQRDWFHRVKAPTLTDSLLSMMQKAESGVSESRELQLTKSVEAVCRDLPYGAVRSSCIFLPTF